MITVAVPVIPMMGALKVCQLQDNLASLDLELSAKQLKSLLEQAESSSIDKIPPSPSPTPQ